MSRKKWVVSPSNKDRAAAIAENCGVEPFAAYLLCARGMTDEFEIESFLYDTDLIDPFTLPDMEKACERIHKAIDNGERITVFGDYDADGVTSTALLYSYLHSCGAQVDCYIPDRADEGYGMNNRAIDSLKERGTQLIVTVDNGVSAIDEIDYANSLGMDVVVTDHHRAGEVLPDAVAVVDPHREDSLCEFSEWAGVGVAFKLVCALSDADGYELLEEYGDIVALGTIADIVSLTGENRIIVRSGIAYVNCAIDEGNLRPGLDAILKESGSEGSVDASSLAFRVAPRINAAGRMGSAYRALKLLLSQNIDEATEIAREISEANAQRQAIEGDITKEAIDIIEKNPNIKNRRVIVVGGQGWHQGVIGIVASRLVERYGKPCIVISQSDDMAKGSGRSIDGFSLYDALSHCGDMLVQYGGHILAAGLTVEADRVDEFREMINEYAEGLVQPVPKLVIDCKLNPANISLDVLDAVNSLQPFGADNPQPLFGFYNMEITELQAVGKGKHLRISARKNNVSITAMLFSTTPEEFPFAVSDKVDMAVKLYANEYKGTVKVNIQVKDIRPAGADDDKVIEAFRAYEVFCYSGKLPQGFVIDRDFCGKVYKLIKSYNGWSFGEETLCVRMGLSEEYILNCKIALDVLTELELIKCTDGKYTLPGDNRKVSLEDSEIFKKATGLM